MMIYRLLHRKLFLSFLLLALSTLFTPALQAAEKPNILVIHSWHDILWDRLWEKGLEDQLGDKYNLIRIDLDAMRSSPEQLKQHADEAWKLYESKNPKLVILGDDVALKVMAMRFANTVPVVYLGINNNPRKLIGQNLPTNFTGVLERPIYIRAMKNIAKILPAGTQKILVLNDSPVKGTAVVTNLGKAFAGKESIKMGKATAVLKVATTWEAWQKAVLSAKKDGYDAILFDSRYILHDKDGKYVEPEPGVIRWMAKHSPVPFFNFYEDSIGPGLSTGGWVISGINHGKAAAVIVKKILDDHIPPEKIKNVYYNEGEYIFSRTQLKKWGLTLPPAIAKEATYTEDLHDLYKFDCKNFKDSVCFEE
ncbi:ABC transporter substrate-binding protein [Dongshaea marina]|uniref:ABC transporter substrate-binding protein n=1 Tax=Dongshaea marina TaxID=2047966 RepID=UPI000D3EABE4|nr:ABC transporter substrate binding protein [Dongshaea marina]